jgi:hypothetical protein
MGINLPPNQRPKIVIGPTRLEGPIKPGPRPERRPGSKYYLVGKKRKKKVGAIFDRLA